MKVGDLLRLVLSAGLVQTDHLMPIVVSSGGEGSLTQPWSVVNKVVDMLYEK